MKKISVLALLLILVIAFPLDTLAYGDDTAESIADMAGADEISGDYLDADEISGNKSINIFGKAFDIICDAFSENGNGIMRSFGMIMGMILLCCVLHSLKFGSAELDTVCGYIAVVALSGVTYSVLYELFILVVASMESLSLLMSSLMPIMASLYVFGGASATGAAASSALTLFLTVLSLLCTKALLPMLRISFALSITGAMPDGINLSPVTNLIKSTATVVMSFLFTLLSFALYFQTSVAAASDNFFAKSVRFVSGVFVPIIGNMLGDASRTVIASVSVVKSTVGAVGVTLIMSVILPPIIIVILNKLMLIACSALAKTLGCDREGALMTELGGILNILLALVIGAGAVSIIAMAVFIKTGVSGA